jgi:hypothetical protein
MMGGVMKYAVEVGACVVIYIPSFMKIGSGIQKLTRGIHRHTQTECDLRSLVLFFENKESRLKWT